MRRIFILSICLCGFMFSYGQMKNPVSWKTEVKKISKKEYQLIFKANVQKRWALYSQYIKEGGPIPTNFTFEPSSAYKLEGNVKELGKNRQEKIDKTFNMKLIKFYDQVIFTQKVIVNDKTQKIKANVRYMSCDDNQCIPPVKEHFEFEL